MVGEPSGGAYILDVAGRLKLSEINRTPGFNRCETGGYAPRLALCMCDAEAYLLFHERSSEPCKVRQVGTGRVCNCQV